MSELLTSRKRGAGKPLRTQYPEMFESFNSSINTLEINQKAFKKHYGWQLRSLRVSTWPSDTKTKLKHLNIPKLET